MFYHLNGRNTLLTAMVCLNIFDKISSADYTFFARSWKSTYGRSVGLTKALLTKPTPCQDLLPTELFVTLLQGERTLLLILRAQVRSVG